MYWGWKMVRFNSPPPPVWIYIYTDIQTYTMVIALSALRIEQAHAARLKIERFRNTLPHTNLKSILKDPRCFAHFRGIVQVRWNVALVRYRTPGTGSAKTKANQGQNFCWQQSQLAAKFHSVSMTTYDTISFNFNVFSMFEMIDMKLNTSKCIKTHMWTNKGHGAKYETSLTDRKHTNCIFVHIHLAQTAKWYPFTTSSLEHCVMQFRRKCTLSTLASLSGNQ